MHVIIERGQELDGTLQLFLIMVMMVVMMMMVMKMMHRRMASKHGGYKGKLLTTEQLRTLIW